MNRKLYIEANYVVVAKVSTGEVDYQRPAKDTAGYIIGDAKLVLNYNDKEQGTFTIAVDKLEDDAGVAFDAVTLQAWITSNTGGGSEGGAGGGAGDATTETTLAEVRDAILATKDSEFVVYIDPNDSDRKVAVSVDLTDPANPIYVYKYLDDNGLYGGDVNALVISNTISDFRIVEHIGEDSSNLGTYIKQKNIYLDSDGFTTFYEAITEYVTLDNNTYSLTGDFIPLTSGVDYEVEEHIGKDSGNNSGDLPSGSTNLIVSSLQDNARYTSSTVTDSSISFDYANLTFSFVSAGFDLSFVEFAGENVDLEISVDVFTSVGLGDVVMNLQPVDNYSGGGSNIPVDILVNTTQTIVLNGSFSRTNDLLPDSNKVVTLSLLGTSSASDTGTILIDNIRVNGTLVGDTSSSTTTGDVYIKQINKYEGNVLAATEYVNIDNTPYTLIGDFQPNVVDNTSLDLLLTYAQYDAWDKIPTQSKEITYYESVSTENPSGNNNVATVVFLEGTDIKVTQSFEYDINDNVIKITAL